MYASVIGKKLVNDKEGKNRTPKEFFDEVYFPIFYDHPKYMLSGGNTPLENPKISWDKRNYPDKANREDRIKKLWKNIEKNIPDTTNSLVAGSSDLTATTSGQITSIDLPFGQEDIISSWIGLGFGIRVESGLILLFNNEEINKKLFEGWEKYRQLLNETDQLKGNQIEAWNAHWLTFLFLNRNAKSQNISLPYKKERSLMKINTQSWIKVLFALAMKFPNEKLTVYVYSLGQTNTTIGFIQINLPEIKREIEMYNHLIGDFDISIKPAIEEVYNTEFGFRTACLNGSIGLKEIEPKNIKKYLSGKTSKTKEFKFKNDEKTIINYNIYLSWVLAMLNDKSTIQKAEKTAEILIEYLEGEKRLKTRSNKVDKLLQSTSRRSFIENLTDILIDDKKNGDFFNQVVEEIEKIQANKFPHFLTLIKFKYNYLKIK